MDIPPHGLAALWFVGLSIFCFALMYWDKRSAVRGNWRVPEKTLLFWAYLGGGIGAVAAQRRFRHKTQKEPFRTLLKGSLLFNALLLIVLLVPSLREAAWRAFEGLL